MKYMKLYEKKNQDRTEEQIRKKEINPVELAKKARNYIDEQKANGNMITVIDALNYLKNK